MAVLLSSQVISHTIGGQFNIAVSKYHVLFDVARELATFHKSLGQISLSAHLFRVHGLAIGHIHAIVVENLTRLQVPLGNGTDLNHLTSDGGRERVAEKDNSCDCIRHFEVYQMIGKEKRIERSV